MVTDLANLTMFVDVDGTFMQVSNGRRRPIAAVVQHIRYLHGQGVLLFCWSSAGVGHARQSAEECGIFECFQAFLHKPNVMLDEYPMEDWNECVYVHPSFCTGRTVDDYRREVESSKLNSIERRLAAYSS